MERKLIQRENKPVPSSRNRKKENELLDLLEIDDSGFILYPAPSHVPLSERRGSPVVQLIDYYLYPNTVREKPIDYDLFLDLIKSKL